MEKINYSFYLSRESRVCKFKFLLIKMLFKTPVSVCNVFASLLAVDTSWFVPVAWKEVSWFCESVTCSCSGKRLVGFPFTCGSRLLLLLWVQSDFY